MKDRTRFLVYGLVFVFFLSFLTGIFTSWAYTQSSIARLVSCLLSLAVVLFLALYNYEPFKSEREREQVLLKRVAGSWVDSLIDVERFVPGTSLMNLDYELSLGAEASGANSKARLGNAFDSAGRSLLILGAEGSGKTISALMLTRDLIKRARRHPGHPIPVVLNLAGWKGEKNLQEWIVNELKAKYDVAEDVALNWLVGKRLLLVLDGLDEVEDRPGCVTAIQQFLTDAAPAGIIVSSRDDDRPMPALRHTLTLKKLSREQIEAYLSQSDFKLTDIAEGDPLQMLLGSPLDLALMATIGKNTLSQVGSRETLTEEFIENRLRLAERMRLPYSRKEIKKKLVWLAGGMKKHKQIVFYIEDLQPSWLPNTLLYPLASRTLATFSIMMLGCLLMLLTDRVVLPYLHTQKLSLGLGFVDQNPWPWLFITIVVGGVIMAGVDYVRFKWSEHRALGARVGATLSGFGDLKTLAPNILICWPVFFLAALPWFGVLLALCGATVYAVAFGLVFWFRGIGQSRKTDIRTADKVMFVFSRSPKGFLRGGAVAAAISLLPLLLVAYIYQLSFALKLWPLLILIGGIVGLVIRGLDKVSIIEKTYPNQGVWLSLRNTVLIWLLVGSACTAVIWIYAAVWSGRWTATFPDAFFFGSVVGLLMGFAYGGIDVVYHVALRFILAAKGYAPLFKYDKFLDHATHLGFLRKVGGGYIFLHGSLLTQIAKTPAVKISERRE